MRRGLLVVAACLSAFAFVPAPAGARQMEVALQDDLLFLYRGGGRGQYFSRDTAFDKMRALQGSALRVNMIWAYTMASNQSNQPNKPEQVVYDWAAYDSIVDLARAYGVKVQFSLTGPAPAWATESGKVAEGYFRPNAQYYGEFTRAAAEHFRGRVKRYSIWNEPNWKTWLGPLEEGPMRYRALYQQGYAGIKGADPSAKVLIGELSPYKKGTASTAPLSFLRQMFCVDANYKRIKGSACKGGALKADGFAQHPYDFTNAPEKARKGNDNVTIGCLDRLTKALDKLAKARVLKSTSARKMGLYLTEFGYFREGARKLNEKKRAAWTTRGFEIARKNPRVKQILYYVFVRPPGGTFFDLSLLDHTGKETRVYRALAKWTKSKKRHLKKPGRKKAGVFDGNPPPPPGTTPPPDGTPPPEEPACPIPMPEGFPCPFAEQRTP